MSTRRVLLVVSHAALLEHSLPQIVIVCSVINNNYLLDIHM